MTLKDRYWFGGFSGTPPSEPNLSTPPPPRDVGKSTASRDYENDDVHRVPKWCNKRCLHQALGTGLELGTCTVNNRYEHSQIFRLPECLEPVSIPPMNCCWPFSHLFVGTLRNNYIRTRFIKLIRHLFLHALAELQHDFDIHNVMQTEPVRIIVNVLNACYTAANAFRCVYY